MPIASTIDWRFVLCDMGGGSITVLNQFMENTQLTFQLNRPAQLTFDIPADILEVTGSLDIGGFTPGFNSQTGDYFPNLSVFGNRWIKGYRKVGTAPGGWTLRFTGRIWTLEDSGDGTTVRTSVTCYDSLYELNKRVIRNANGAYRNVHTRFFGSPAGSDTYSSAIKAMINRANGDGVSQTILPLSRTTIDVAGGTWHTTAPFTNTYNHQFILPEVIKMTDTGLVDLDVTYLDPDGSIPGVVPYMRLGASPEAGSDNPTIIFGYAGPPRSASAMTRTESLDTLANDIVMFGKSPAGRGVRHFSKPSVAVYGAFEDIVTESTIHNKQLLADLVAEQIALRKNPRELVNVLPLEGIAPPPWEDENGTTWVLGDRIQVVIGTPADPVARRTTSGVQRVYGFTIGMDSTFSEHITNMVMSADAESNV